jgi:hypothetical protein
MSNKENIDSQIANKFLMIFQSKPPKFRLAFNKQCDLTTTSFLEKTNVNHMKQIHSKKQSYHKILNLFLSSLQQEINNISIMIDKRKNS